MKRKILLIILTIFAAALLAGCGELSYEMKARSYAESYIKDKYGFDADITEVLTSGNGWLEFSWEAPEFAHVGMRYDGTDFVVLVPIRDYDSAMLCDSYEAGAICAEIEKYVRERLSCVSIAFRIDYGCPYGNHLLPKDIRSAEDLARSEDQKTISVFTHGLDPAGVEALDPAVFGGNTRFSVVEWEEEELPEVPYGLIRELPSQCGWNVNAVHYTDNDGSWKHMDYDRIVMGNVCLVMPSECNITMEPAEGPGTEEDVPVTDWYCIKGTGEGFGALYASVGAEPEEEYCVEYEFKGKPYYERMPHTDGDSPKYELYSHRYCSGASGSDYTFRVVKRDFYKDAKE